MKNKEKYADKILEIACDAKRIAVDKKTLEPTVCSGEIDCHHCLFNTCNNGCSSALRDWANAEYKEPLTAERLSHEFAEFCINDGSCAKCMPSGILRHSSKCVINFILDNYNVTEKEDDTND